MSCLLRRRAPLSVCLLFALLCLNFPSDAPPLSLQAADARRALPCWDEPAHKATFDVILVVPKDRVALSNMVHTITTVLNYF